MKLPVTSRPWFKAKQYGWGWYPATWQGWLILFLWGVCVIANVFRLGNFESNPSATAEFFIETVILSLLLVLVSYLTGEKPGWRWGNSTSKNDQDKPKDE